MILANLLFKVLERSVIGRLHLLIGKLLTNTLPNVNTNSVTLEGYMTITNKNLLYIGDYSSIGRSCFFHTNGTLRIGSNVQISRRVTIYTSMHNYNTGTMIPYDKNDLHKTVEIKDHVWVGMNASILPGVTVGEGAIIGMNSVITKNVPPLAIVVGIDRVVGYRNENHFKNLKEQKLFFGKAQS